MKGRMPYSMWKRIFRRVPRVVVDLVIRDKMGVVLAKREKTYGAGKWNLPGGQILFGESIGHAVRRKAKEETGLNVKVVKFLGVYEYPLKGNFGYPISLCFLCKPVSGKLHGNKYGKGVGFFKKLPKIGFTQINIIKGRKMIK